MPTTTSATSAHTELSDSTVVDTDGGIGAASSARSSRCCRRRPGLVPPVPLLAPVPEGAPVPDGVVSAGGSVAVGLRPGWA